MSFSGPGLSNANDSDIASYRRLEAKILAEEREKDPNFTTCHKCVARFTEKAHVQRLHNYLHHHDSNKHHEVNSNGDVLIARNMDEMEEKGSDGDDESERRSSRGSLRPSRVERHSYSENEEKQRFHGAFR